MKAVSIIDSYWQLQIVKMFWLLLVATRVHNYKSLFGTWAYEGDSITKIITTYNMKTQKIITAQCMNPER